MTYIPVYILANKKYLPFIFERCTIRYDLTCPLGGGEGGGGEGGGGGREVVRTVKGTVPRDFRLLVFFMNQFPPRP
jgi:hypothetical protein